MADSIKVTLTPSTIEARPSTPAVMVVTIHNTGQTVEQYSIEIEGLSSSWYSLPETRVALFPNDRDDVRITILPSLEAGMAAGSHSFTITVVAQANPAERATANGIIKVAAATALEAQLRPSRATGRKARYRVLLRNAGNSAVDVDLDATDSEEGCDFAFKPAMVSIEPGRKVEIGVRVRPVHPRLVGTEHSFDFRVMVQPNLGEARPLQGHFIYKPRFRSWRPFTRLVSLVALVVIAIVAAPFILMQARKAAQVINVQPNVAMGSVKLGATNPDSIMAAMGAGAIMTNHETLITQPQKAGIMTAHLRQGQVVSMLTTSPAFTMTGDVHVGSPVSAVQKAFGNSVAVIGQNAVAASTMGNGGLTPVATVGTTVMPAKALAGGALVVVGKNTMDGGHAMTFFDLNKTGTKVVAVRMGYYPWITADHGGPTQVKAITSTTTWGITGGPYIVTGNVRIPKGVALTISPGVHVFFTDVNSSLKVDGGMLSAVGTANAPVVFTSIRDPKHGAIDTLMRPAPQPGDWGSLGVTAAGGTLQLANTQIYFGGSSAKNGNAELNIDGTGNPNVSIQNSDIAGAKGYGLNAATAPVGTQIQGNTFAANEFPMLIGGGISVDNSNVFTSKADPPNKHNAVYVTPSATIAANGATVVW
ncbi:MAG: serine/threonine protein kinase with domain, partial [Chloroflexi bacterium]|nr:serine/threonine protein kinase with domain [Chloroflexota bacterium]